LRQLDRQLERKEKRGEERCIGPGEGERRSGGLYLVL